VPDRCRAAAAAPLLREYAAEKLKAPSPVQQGYLGDSMVSFLLTYAEAHPGCEGVDALEAEAAGLMGTVAWAREQARHQAVLGLAYALRQAREVRGRREEEWHLHLWANHAAQELADPKQQSWTSYLLALIQERRGHLAEAQAGFGQTLTLGRQEGDLELE
jgi:hypothetical protein